MMPAFKTELYRSLIPESQSAVHSRRECQEAQALQLFLELRALDRANYTSLVREKELRRRSKRDYPIPCFEERVKLFESVGEIMDSLAQRFIGLYDRNLAYSTVGCN